MTKQKHSSGGSFIEIDFKNAKKWAWASSKGKYVEPILHHERDLVIRGRDSLSSILVRK